jgi:periplasmic protein TonB
MKYFKNPILLIAAVLWCNLIYGQQVPPPPPPMIEEEEVFVRCEVMPRFPGCEDMEGTNEQKSECAQKKLFEYINTNLKYPEEAKKNGVQGQVVLKFVVNKVGEITKVEILRDPGAGLGEAAKELVLSMNKMTERWSSGKQRNRPVNVWYTLPVKFSLGESVKK